jgi:hypothetical protein
MSKLVGKSSRNQNSSVFSNRTERLSKQQLRILEFIYGYRFVNTKQVQLLLGKKQIQQAQQRLNTLLNNEYIGRNFSNTDRLTGKYASYYLLPKGLRLLKRCGANVDTRVLRNMYKDRTASDRFIAHSLSIGNIYADLSRLYGEKLDLSTKSQLTAYDLDYEENPDNGHLYDSFPQPLPDAYLAIYDSEDNGYEFLLEVWHDNVPFFVYRNRIKYYTEYVSNKTYKDAFGSDLPTVLLICESITLQRRVQRFLKKYTNETYTNELKFLITNNQLLATVHSTMAIWSEYNEDSEKFAWRALITT